MFTNSPTGNNFIEMAGTTTLPSKVVCIGRNFVEHIEELNNEVPEEMVLFIKPNTAISKTLLIDSSGSEQQVHFETEICFVVENGAFVAVGLGLDLTKRTIQTKLKQKGLPWERAKAFKGSATFSPFIPITTPIASLNMKVWRNDVLQQAGGVAQMINKPDDILAEIDAVFSTNNGDVIMTGTPKGVGQVVVGDQFTAELFDGDERLLRHQWLAIDNETCIDNN